MEEVAQKRKLAAISKLKSGYVYETSEKQGGDLMNVPLWSHKN